MLKNAKVWLQGNDDNPLDVKGVIAYDDQEFWFILETVEREYYFPKNQLNFLLMEEPEE